MPSARVCRTLCAFVREMNYSVCELCKTCRGGMRIRMQDLGVERGFDTLLSQSLLLSQVCSCDKPPLPNTIRLQWPRTLFAGLQA